MDQKELRELEKKCTQEEPAPCIAACPIHVDARQLIRHIQNKKWNDAWKILCKTMPFPGILARICDAPCKNLCMRGKIENSIEIGMLEQACVKMPAPRYLLPPISPKDKSVAVLGSGLSSLTLCWDLARKGYRITVFEQGATLGAVLENITPSVLSGEMIEEELSVLSRMGVQTIYHAPPATESFLDRCLNDFDAVYIGLDTVSSGQTGLPTDPGGMLHVNEKLQTTGIDRVFAGGCSSQSAASPIWQVAEGRWAATTIDRYLQKVSITAGREKEGPYPTRLYTDTAGYSPSPAIKPDDAQAGYNPDEAVEEARRCLLCECLECVKVCTYLEHFGSYPKRYTREIYNNESIVMGAHQANRLINSCSLCGLCQQVCPQGFAMQDVCLAARQSMVQRNKMPPSAHEFALMDMAFSKSEAFAMTRHQPGKKTSEFLFFPGCQICASSPDKVFQTYQYLCENISNGVGLMLGCCSAPAYWAGRSDQFKNDLQSFKEKWIRMGRPKLVPACCTCFRIFSDHLPDIPIVSIWSLFEKYGLPSPARSCENLAAALHDPCTSRNEPQIQDTLRRLLKASKIDIEELPLSKSLTECCGFGGLMQNANPDIARESIRRRSGLSEKDYITYCGMCRDSLASTGKRVWHILDILFPDPQNPDPASKAPPGWSQRRENRSRLQDRFKKELWKEKSVEQKDQDTVRLRITPQVREKLEQRRILDEDIRKVILHARESGKTFKNEETGYFKAAFKPHNVTFWVEYSQQPDGVFDIHNAYSHRMEVIES